MKPRFYFHQPAGEPQETFIASPITPTSLTFGGWGPKL